MSTQQPFTELIQWHKAIEFFDYNLVVDWSLRLLERGVETENILILTSFSKPVNVYEITPYVSAVLSDLELEEKSGLGWILVLAKWSVGEIIEENNIKSHLSKLAELSYTHNNYQLKIFQDFHYAWSDLIDGGEQWYVERDVNLENIKIKVKEEAAKWIETQLNPQQEVKKAPLLESFNARADKDVTNSKWYHFFRQ